MDDNSPWGRNELEKTERLSLSQAMQVETSI